MDISKLKPKMVFNNYKALCEAVNIKQMTGKSKQMQLDEFSQYVTYRRDGHKFIIEEIIDQPDALALNSSKSPYIKLIETLLVAMLVGSSNDIIEKSYGELFFDLCMASVNYKKIYNESEYDNIYNSIAPIDKDVYVDFRRNSYNENKKKIKSALESMKKRMLIDYEEVDYAVIDEYYDDKHHKVHFPISDKQKKEYLELRYEIMKSFNCNSEDELKAKHRYKEFEEKVAKKAEEQFLWLYKYKKVKIIHILQGKIDNLNATKENLYREARRQNTEVNKQELNAAIAKMINKIGENNHNNSVRKIEEWQQGDEDWGKQPEMPYSIASISFRARDSYLPSWNVLSEYFIVGDKDSAASAWKEYSDKTVSDICEEDEIDLFVENTVSS